MTKSIFYVALCLAFGFTACIPKDSTQATEPEKLNIYLDVRDCTGQYRYGATVETIDGKYKHTLEQSVEGMTLSVPIGATSFTFRVKEERGNIISYRDTTINVSADDRIANLTMSVKCDGYVKVRVLDRVGAPTTGIIGFTTNNFVVIDSSRTTFLVPIRYNPVAATSPNFSVVKQNLPIGERGNGILLPTIAFGDTLNVGDVYGEMVSSFSYIVNGDGFVNKTVQQLPTDVCSENSGASTILGGDFWLQMIDQAGCGQNGINTTRLWLENTPTTVGNYTLKGGEFAFQGNNSELYSPATMQFTITKLGASGRLVEGTFSGTASYTDSQNIVHTINITTGVFKVLRKN